MAAECRAEVLPPSASLIFPPFPFSSTVTSIQNWQHPGLVLPNSAAFHTVPSPVEPAVEIGSTAKPSSRTPHATRAPKYDKWKLATGMAKEDAWKIGEEGGSWVEPEGTSRSDFNVSSPPFSRLLAATRDFMASRNEEFNFRRTKRLFTLLRNTLGIRSEFSGRHRPGMGPDGTAYSSPRHAGAAGAAVSAGDEEMFDEACVLIRDPETSVRGFLALARREAEAGWDFEPALRLSQITAAYLTFLEHHQVLPDVPGITNAAALARVAPRLLTEAKWLEDIICCTSGWNRACWSAWGGSYGGPERGGMEKEDVLWGATTVGESSAADGGWTVDPVIDSRPEALAPEQALAILGEWLKPRDVHCVSMIGYLPYARRRITAVLPPLPVAGDTPSFASKLWRLVTVPAPWTPAERWRDHRPTFDAEPDDDENRDDRNVLEGEVASIEEPGEIVLWVDGETLIAQRGVRLEGMALRGRWALFGDNSGEPMASWWAFKAKDFILPSFWQK